MYRIRIKKKSAKNIEKAPEDIRKRFKLLVENLKQSGPVQNAWPNYSKLESNKYHCHLSYSWVVCWYNEKNTLLIEVYYAGSREKAPY
jgi:mRNA-degrading endonuclease RelE of RelBE toxin-antitoxin system